MKHTSSVLLSHTGLQIIREYASQSVVSQATQLLMLNAVHIVRQDHWGEGIDVLAVVMPAGGPAHTALTVYEGDEDFEWDCSCQAPGLCAHAAATLLAVYADGVSTQPAAPSWRTELDSALSSPRQTQSTELCLFLSVVTPNDRAFSSEPELCVRPGMRGTRDKWIKGQAKWSALEALGAPRLQVAAFQTLHQVARAGYGYHPGDGDWVNTARLPGPPLWSALRELHHAGVPIVSWGKQQHPVEFATEVVCVTGTIRRAGAGTDAGDLIIGAEARLRAESPSAPLDQAHTWWLGEPATSLAVVTNPSEPGERFTLHPLVEPLTPLARKIFDGHDLTVPVADQGQFETDYLPRILAELPLDSPDDSYTPPPPPRTTLLLTVQHAAEPGHPTRVSWAWQRHSGLSRNPLAEQQLLAAVHDAAGDVAHLVWPHLIPAARALTAAAPVTPATSVADVAQGVETPSQELEVAPKGSTSTVSAHRQVPPDQVLARSTAVLFVAEALPALRDVDGLELIELGDTPQYRAAQADPFITVNTEATGDWFDLHVTVNIEGEAVDFASLFTALALGDPIFVLPSGTYFSLQRPEFDVLRHILAEARALVDAGATPFAEGVRVNRYNVDLWSELTELGIVTAQTNDWWHAIEQLAPGATIDRVAQPAGLHATLRDYQEHGLAWLHFLRTHGLGGILADDMGLGKTLQTIGMMELAREENPQLAPFLVVAPTSVVSNWASECAKFAPGLRVAVISGMERKRGKPLADAVGDAHVVLTSYALFRGEAEEYRELEWSGLILDEAQQIKNSSSHGHRAARTLGAPFTLVVTGTPLENNLLELWSLVSLAAPGLLGNKARFTEFYRTPIEKQHDGARLALLQRRLKPFLLRRTKDLVAADLPPKQEQVLEIELHPKHRRLYDVRFQRERQKILGLIGDVEGNQFQIFQSLTMLRQLALDPALVGAGDAPSAKLDALIELLTEAAQEGHRVLVLSQFTRFLGAARDRAEEAGLASHYLDGSTTDRGSVIDGFRQGDAPVFFVSLKAGGFGLNLVEADYVVLLDPWWNPAVEAQAIDRTHRIGQERPVFVYRLVAARTIEEKVIALREAKAALFEQVLGGGGVGSGVLNADDIRDLLADEG